MGLPAVVAKLPPDVLPAEQAAVMGERLRAILRRVRADRPAEHSTAEREAIDAWLDASMEVGPAWVRALGDGIDEWFLSLMQAEIDRPTEPERRLSVRWLADAVGTLARLVELVAGQIGPQLDDQAFAALMAMIGRQRGLPLDPDAHLVLRWQIDLFAALECLGDEGADPAELAFWARRAFRGANAVELLMRDPMRGVIQGEIARTQARRAWLDWDDAEVARELAPWPRRSP
jgi:hypothetical protein